MASGNSYQTETRLSDFNASLTVTTNKLDADQYSANDLDGVTESLFGSGNMAYASLQASQTDAILSDNFGNYQTNEHVATSDPAAASSPKSSIGHDNNTTIEALSTEGNFSNTTVGTIGASTLSSDNGNFASDSNLGFGNANLFSSEFSNSSQNNNHSNGSEASLNNVSGDVNNNSNNTSNEIVNQVIDNSINLGDEINEIIEGDTVSEIVTNLQVTLIDLSETISVTLNSVTDIVNSLLITTHITEVINTVTDTTNIVTNNITNIVDTLFDGDVGVLLDLDILESLDVFLEVSLQDSLEGSLNIGAITNNLSVITNDLTGLSTPSLSILDLDVNFDLLSGNNIEDGNDVVIAGVTTPNIDLDLVEDLIGDVDINVNVADTLLENGDLLEQVADTLNTLDNLSLDGLDNVLDIVGDEGINGAVGVVLDNLQIDEDLNLSVNDALEELGLEIGDDHDQQSALISDTLDPVIENTLDVVNDITDGALQNITNDTYNVIDDVTDVLDAVTGGLTGGLLGNNNDNQDGQDSDVVVDTDIEIIDQIATNETIEVALDPVEDLIGDLDVQLGVSTDLLGQNATDVDNENGDQDIPIDTGIDIIDENLAQINENPELDAIEDIIGDVDLDIDIAANLLGDIAPPLTDDAEGGTGEDTLLSDLGDNVEDIVHDLLDVTGLDDALPLLGESNTDDNGPSDNTGWTETTLVDGGLFDDVVNGIGGESDALPEPLGTVSEGLGILDVDPIIGSESLGGLFG